MKRLTVMIVLATGLAAASSSQAVFFHIGSGSIDGSLCVGNDCVSSEAFGFDTIRLKENNLRIHFLDTSSTSSFPARDWRILINDTSNGGANYFAVEDANSGNVPFKVGVARNNALVVDSQGDVGVGTATPATDIDIKIGDTPTLRLQQDGTSGFTPQTWDVAGNEAGFFIRDATSGSTLPFRILTGGAPSQSLVIDGDGEVGIGAGTTPDAALHVSRGDTAQVLVQNTTGTAAARTLLKLTNAGNTKFEIENTDAGDTWAFSNSGVDFRVSRQGSSGVEFRILDNGDAILLGTLTQGSDRDAKQGIEPVDAAEMLDKVLELPVNRWQYKERPGVDHIGPMAQDFHAAFGVGASEKGISTLDSSGVAFAAIQALGARDEAHAAEMDALRVKVQELDALRAEVEELRGINRALEARVTENERDRERLRALEVIVRNLLPQAAPVLTAEAGD